MREAASIRACGILFSEKGFPNKKRRQVLCLTPLRTALEGLEVGLCYCGTSSNCDDSSERNSERAAALWT